MKNHKPFKSAKLLICHLVLFVFLGASGNTIASEQLEDIALKYKDALACYLLGQKYAVGRGTKQNFQEALKWYKAAAKIGHVKSEFQIGRIYFQGRGTTVDYDQAALWLQNPAKDGYNSAQYMLGKIYLTGSRDLIKKNKEQAFIWLKKAADDFHREATYDVGYMLYHGIGTKKDKQAAKKYLLLAQEQNISEAEPLLALLEPRALQPDLYGPSSTDRNRTTIADNKNFRSGISKPGNASVKPGKIAAEAPGDFIGLQAKAPAVAKTPERKRLSKAQRKKQRVKKTLVAAKKGDSEAQFKIGIMYLNGADGFSKNNKNALRWLKAAASQNHTLAQFQTGMMFYKPNETNNDVAQNWLLKAAVNDHVDAQYFLGTIFLSQQKYQKAVEWLDTAFRNRHEDALDLLVDMYTRGKLENPDETRVLAWLEKASLSGFRTAQFELGKHYLSHDDIANNNQKAYAWIEKAARKGLLPAKYQLGVLLQKGIGARRHYTRSARWYREAAKEGHQDAQFALAELYRNGFGLPKSKSKAKKWYSAAADQGHRKARLRLGSDNRY